jgi:hypothetical protein
VRFRFCGTPPANPAAGIRKAAVNDTSMNRWLAGRVCNPSPGPLDGPTDGKPIPQFMESARVRCSPLRAAAKQAAPAPRMDGRKFISARPEGLIGLVFLRCAEDQPQHASNFSTP